MSFFDRALARMSELPGVTAAGAANMIPLDGNGTDRLIDIEGYIPRDTSDMPDAQNRQATPGWFAAMGIPLVRGRLIERSDDQKAARVLVVNEEFAKRFFPNGDPIGKRIRLVFSMAIQSTFKNASLPELTEGAANATEPT